MTAGRSGYVPVDGMDLYYEAHGEHGEHGASGIPLLLIPGPCMSCDSMA